MGVAIIIEEEDRDRVASAFAMAAQAIEAEARISGAAGNSGRERRLYAEAGRLHRLAETTRRSVNV
jgi:hypothetical protein